VEIRPYTPDLEPAVKAFNQRLQVGGEKQWRIPESHVQRFPKNNGRNPYQEFFLAWHDGKVRGGYLLTHSRFSVRGQIVSIACGPQLNLSEGIVNPAYSMIGVIQLQDALQRQPLMYGLGMGGMNAPLTNLFNAMGWQSFPVPFHFRVESPTHFFENINYLRRSKLDRAVLDLLRYTGAGWLGVRVMQARLPGVHDGVSSKSIAGFESWVDAVWDRCKDWYSLIAVRDSATLNDLYPPDDSRFLRLRIRRGNRDLGWVVMLDTQMSGHKQFGSMRVGSIVDCLASPADTGDVIRAATKFLETRGVDIIISNQSSSAWCKALEANGYITGPSNFILALSPKLAGRLTPLPEHKPAIHMNRGDGDGPINL
jgi:hypothetical protein